MNEFGVVGAGTVGTLLAVCLERSGLYCCAGVNTRSRESWERFRGFLREVRQEKRQGNQENGQKEMAHYSLEELAQRCSLIFIATPDDVIAQVAETLHRGFALAEKKGSERMLVHCSGALPWRVMASESAGSTVRYAGVHPYRAFASIADGMASVSGTHFGVDGSGDEAVACGQEIVQALGGVFHRIAEGGKTLYHAAAVMTSNYLVTLAAMGADLLGRIGCTPEERLELLLPLMQGTLENLKKGGLDVLTGPIARGDTEVVRRHLAELPEEMNGAYRSLGMWALKLARHQCEQTGRVYSAEAEAVLRGLLAEREGLAKRKGS